MSGRSLLAGLLVGVGVAAFVDEVVFHQLLHWHHFYDRSTTDAGLVSDGLLHAGGWTATVVGLFLFADLQRRHATVPLRVWAGGLLGAGGFQLYDGLVQHKLLRLHQVRYGVDLLPYDLAWNAPGAVAVLVGLLLLRRARGRGAGGSAGGGSPVGGATATGRLPS
ncbi:DUF2243 domain-containing protein [Modestobacter sp. I12A-02628]|uniref:DUF2243 domain-containing protein n=1 Tax=Goekera deserti TaxID=2497753 RepID=A0A7K3WKA8_9ACTN|nr:DUF2243 domain-containing protein [Goekera deserti]MPQ96378.1 DUF2243 domain-containing protein [Goekera deserti]NDI47310.1 DUF2243 domain-containing protein [Goekera deserti]NEL56140.1 DUF2243 domain-containing protein [Goekera deserti]